MLFILLRLLLASADSVSPAHLNATYDSFGCPPATLPDAGPPLLIINNNSFNALSISSIQDYSYFTYSVKGFKIHCPSSDVIPPGASRTIILDRSVYMLFLEWHAPKLDGGWQYIDKAPPGEIYKNGAKRGGEDCSTTSGWPLKGVVVSAGDLGQSQWPYCSDDSQCAKWPGTKCVLDPGGPLGVWGCKTWPPTTALATPLVPTKIPESATTKGSEYPLSWEYPRECPQDGEPAPHSCTCSTPGSDGYDVTVTIEVEAQGVFTICPIVRTCTDRWVTLQQIIPAHQLKANSISKHVVISSTWYKPRYTTLARTPAGACVIRTGYTQVAVVDHDWCAPSALLALSPSGYGAGLFAAVRSSGAITIFNVTLSQNDTVAAVAALFIMRGREAGQVTAVDLNGGETGGFFFVTNSIVILQTTRPLRRQVFALPEGIVVNRLSSGDNLATLYTTADGKKCTGDMITNSTSGKAILNCDNQLVNDVDSPDIGLANVVVKDGTSFYEFLDSTHIRVQYLGNPEFLIHPEYSPIVASWVNSSLQRTLLSAEFHG